MRGGGCAVGLLGEVGESGGMRACEITQGLKMNRILTNGEGFGVMFVEKHQKGSEGPLRS